MDGTVQGEDYRRLNIWSHTVKVDPPNNNIGIFNEARNSLPILNVDQICAGI